MRSSADRIRTRILHTLLQVINTGMDVVDSRLLTNSNQSSGRSYPENVDDRPELGKSRVLAYAKPGTRQGGVFGVERVSGNAEVQGSIIGTSADEDG